MIVLRPPWGQPVDRFFVRWAGFSPMTLQYALASGAPVSNAYRNARASLLLTTIGRRSGQLRTTVLPYFDYEGDLVICGTNGGGPRDPQWVDNIRTNGQVWVRIDRQLVPAEAHVSEGEERAHVFETIAPQHGGLRRYQKQATTHGRDVPLIVIKRRSG